MSKDEFYKNSLFGRWFSLTERVDVDIDLYANNVEGLPKIYNESISKIIEDDVILIFIHDDVFILDLYWDVKIRQSLDKFDLVGVAGSTIFSELQPAWCVKNVDLEWIENKFLRGRIYHGNSLENLCISDFNILTGEVKIIDGVFIAVKSKTLREVGIAFDERFKFHMYDTDFCRSADNLMLKIGVCDISLMHSSAGVVDDNWRNAYNVYYSKWFVNVDK